MHYFEQHYRVASAADIASIEALPLEERCLPASTYDLLRNAAQSFSDRVAIHDVQNGDEYRNCAAVTYGELLRGIHRVANLLHELGIRENDVVGVLMPSIVEAQFALWGSQAAGILCSINWMLDPEIVIKLLESADAKVLIAFGPHADFEIWEKVEQIRRRLPALRSIIKMGGGQVADATVIDFATVQQHYRDDMLVSNRTFSATQTASLFHTGGTTGTPKLARHTHGNEVFMSWVSAVQYDILPGDVRVCGVPLFHVTGVLTNCLMPLSRGATVVMLTASGWRNPTVLRNLWSMIDHYKITSLSLVPSVVNMLLNIPIRNADISSLKIVSSGTAPLSVNVSKAFREMTGALIVEGYGLTEATAISATNPRYGETKIGSVGLRTAYQQLKAVVIDRAGNWVRDCAPMESGVIVVSGPNVFPGYLDPAQNDRLWVADGWLNTGDLGYIDEEGYCFLTGRAKDLIIRGGNNIDPRLIEEAFYAHPNVADAAAVAMPDAHAGELPVVFIAPKPGTSLSVPRLKFYAYETIPERAAVPKAFYVVDQLPKTAVGKVQKNTLRLETVRRAQLEALAEIEGVGAVDVAVSDRTDTGIHSTIAVTLAPEAQEKQVRASIDEALLRFTVRYDIHVRVGVASPAQALEESLQSMSAS